MIDSWRNRFPRIESMTLIRELPCAIADLRLAIVDVKGKQGSPQGYYLLQLYKTTNPQAVIEAQQQVDRLGIDLHLPTLIDAPAQNGDQVALLTDRDGVSWRSIDPLSSRLTNPRLSLDSLRESLEALAALLRSWNDPRDVLRNRRSTSVFDFLKSAVTQTEAASAQVRVADRMLPNPVAYLTHSELWANVEPLFEFRGLAFGHLSVENIYFQNQTPLLIDARNTAIEAHVLSDWATLEVSLLLNFCPLRTEGDWSAWLALCESLSTNLMIPTGSGLPRGAAQDAAQILSPLRRTIGEYAAAMSGVRSLFEMSFWLTLLQAALRAADQNPLPERRAAATAYAALLFARLANELRLPVLPNGAIEMVALPVAPVTVPDIGQRTGGQVDPADRLPIQPIRQRWALLVGINQYSEPSYPTLNFCVSDVTAMERALGDLGYETLVLSDAAGEERLKPRFANIMAELNNVLGAMIPESDAIWLHFSCHGDLIDGQPVLITQDYRDYGHQNVLTLDDLLDALTAKQMRRVIITLDACHAGVEGPRGKLSPEFIQNVHELGEGYAIIAASTSQQRALEWREKQLGLFTYYLMDGLSGSADHDDKQFVTVGDLKDYVVDGLRRWRVKHGVIQDPTARVSGIGDMILADFRPKP